MSERTGLGIRYLLRRVESGELVPAQQLPGLRGAFLFRREDIDELVEQRRAS